MSETSLPARLTLPRRRTTLHRFVENRAGVAAAALLIALSVVAIFDPILMPHDPLAQDLMNTLAPPLSPGHLLGTDELGRDVLSRLISASRVAMIAPLIVIAVALGLGLVPGLVAGYFAGLWDSLIMRLVDALQSFPPILLALAIVTVLGPGLFNAMVAVGLVFTPGIVRITRASVLAIRREAYVEAAITMGVSPPVIITRHILPNAIGPLLVQVSLLTGFALLAEATLSFIGIGVEPPEASWGAMIFNGFKVMSRQPLLWLWPSILLGLTVLSWNILGDALRDSIGKEERRA